MIKLIATALLFLSVNSYAETLPPFTDINIKDITSISILPPAIPKPLAEIDNTSIVTPLLLKTNNDYYFNDYILKAVDYLNKNYRLKGYNIKAVLTHDIPYGTLGNIKATKPPQTMCVAAVMEVMLTAFQQYANETKDYSVYNYLPKSSYEKLGSGDIKGHIWVNHDFNSYGTSDALYNFGMGEKVKFEELRPGAFVNINRTTKTGHAVVFLSYINALGKEQTNYNNDVIGFKYFSSQGKAEAGQGGFDYRYAIFSKHGCPVLKTNIKRDCNVIYSEDQVYLNTGMMLSPKYWTGITPKVYNMKGYSVLDENYFNGVTTDDDK